jgi:eukaryotic-like serine/threonine-protein kinase
MDPDRWRKIEELYHAASDCSAGERSRFLEEACGGDEALRREVEALLAQEGRAADFLESPALDVAAKAWVQAMAATGAERLIGQTVSHYKVLEKLGAGGMGDVYRAHDTKLKRDVALKVLPEGFASDAQRMARFEREARVLASLNHPNIATVHGLEESGSTRALVMELVQGPTLAERLAKGLLSTAEVLRIAIEICEGLEAAHRAGVVHRDLKPQNIMLTKAGVKIVDFGLAKPVEAGPSLNSLPTASTAGEPVGGPVTKEGTILGTLQYASPEQLQGQDADERSDIFSFGAVLYEMAAGKRAFEGTSQASVIAAVLDRQPTPISELQPVSPPALDRVVATCLAKDPDDRFQSVHDVRLALEWIRDASAARGASAASETARHPEITEARPILRRAVPWVLSVVIAIAALAYVFRPRLPPPTVSNFVQLTHDAAPKLLIGTDGARLYLEENLPAPTLCQISVAGGDVVAMPALSPRMYPLSVSPDGSAILMSQGVGLCDTCPLWAVPTVGGSPRRLATAAGPGGAWSPDGEKLAYADSNNLYLADAEGTQPTKLDALPGATKFAWSPDGKEIRFTMGDIFEHQRIWQVSRDGSNLHQFLPGWNAGAQCCGSWMPDGNYYVFEADGQIWARRETGSLLRKANYEPVQLTSGAITYRGFYVVPSKGGKKLFAVEALPRGELERYDSKSKAFTPFLGGISAQDTAFSKDGQWVAYVLFPEGTLWRSKVDGSEKLQLSFPPLYAMQPRWSPDGTELVFWAMETGKPPRIYLTSPSGGAPRELMPDNSTNIQADGTWSPDGNSIAFTGGPSGAGPARAEIDISNLKTHQISMLSGSQGFYSPRWSPDGRYLIAMPTDAYSLRLYDFKLHKWSVLASANPAYPCWSRNSEYVYFLDRQRAPAIVRVSIRDHKLEQIASLKGVRTTGYFGEWFGLVPDDSPLTLKDVGTEEVVSIDFHEP